ncbi:MAG: FmdB family zinc ribbon protein [Thermoanaerobaculia bacterium]
MPIYEYDCKKCGKKTEVIQRVGEEPLKVCPHCSGRLKKAFSAPAIQFKGSGWYITDYARAKQEGGGEKASGAKSDDGEKAEASDKKADTSDKAAKSEKSEKQDKKKAKKTSD